ncbi:hypothetical protein ASPWEDRAFT_172348 [Aspergillus wentii DTO 134E9]|uniref:Protein kinase domain-containing protein n=1 Tax=Aspergillus wentii DTO 134E9 TaxID=1073089 RepID=A0A1L9RKT3_ASPWE|nr:uncharacterized protein ASPWEDRAFT_172348 [Aspergillus wentii DTO 134E9]KAI9924689.1 hypothetical protein MW887_006541 [Aspergillus wentii]OJJ35546.1 hypothetical protein ASPWEDRAFT_172348 [Aspergillus wentii DTO 134E9]
MEMDNIKPAEIIFKEKLYSSQHSIIFLVTIRNITQHHGRGPRLYYESANRELDIHIVEATAYHRLKQFGLCDRGIVPNFLGTMRKFNPSLCRPHLDTFLEDEYPPSAIFLEYIPGLEMIYLNNYTPQRMDNLVTGIQEIHKAGVLHADPKPRNMMVVAGDAERVVWLDFDRSYTYTLGSMTEQEQARLENEEVRIVGIKEYLGADCATGTLDKAYIFYT